MGCSSKFIPGIGEAYLVIDADTNFRADYSPFPPGNDVAYNYIPGDPRDCGNPPYFMTI
jgi:hypothetical protein